MTVTRTHTYPEGTAPGVYTITATDGVNTAQAQITILDQIPNTITVDPTTIAAGGSVTVTGEGYPTETAGTVTVTMVDGDTVATVEVTTDAEGNIPETTVAIPDDAAPGEYTVAADVDGQTAETTLTVEERQQLVAPTGLEATDVTETAITVTWEASDNADQYVVEYKLAADEEWTARPAVEETTDTLPDLETGQEYNVRVIAQDSTGAFADSDPSEAINATTSGTPLAPPDDVAVASVTADSITVTWTANEDAAGYVVRFREEGASEWTTRPEVEAGTVTDTIPDLTAGTTYEIQVRSVGDGTAHTDSPFGPETPVTGVPAEQLAAPTGLAADGETETSVNLSWTAVEEATGYHVQYKVTDEADWVDWGEDPTESAVVVDGLTGATSYDFIVKAVGGGGFSDSDYSDPVTTSTL